MVPIGDTHKRFNVRFYIVAMIFLVIDVDIIFFYPVGDDLRPRTSAPSMPTAATMLIEMIVFVVLAAAGVRLRLGQRRVPLGLIGARSGVRGSARMFSRPAWLLTSTPYLAYTCLGPHA